MSDTGPWIDFACAVSRALCSPDAEDYADMVSVEDLPTLAECLRGQLAEQSASISALRAEVEGLQAEVERLRAELATIREARDAIAQDADYYRDVLINAGVEFDDGEEE